MNKATAAKYYRQTIYPSQGFQKIVNQNLEVKNSQWFLLNKKNKKISIKRPSTLKMAKFERKFKFL